MSRMSRVSNAANHAHRLRNASYAPTSTPDAQRQRGSAGVPENTAKPPISTPIKTVPLTSVPIDALTYPYPTRTTAQHRLG